MLHSTLFNLEQITQLISRSRRIHEMPDDPHVSIKVVDYGEGRYKVAISSLRNKPGFSGTKRALVGSERSAMDGDVLARAARRAQTALRDAIIATRCNSMLTFTARFGLSRDELIASVGDFAAALRALDHDFPMILVPETHHGGGANDGTLHAHAAVLLPMFIDYKLLHGAWNVALRRNVPRLNDADPSISQGTVNVSARSSSPMSLAKYLAKYISKDFDDGIAHKKRYVCYGPVRRAIKTVTVIPSMESPPLAELVAAALRITGADRGWQIDSKYSQVFLCDNLWPALSSENIDISRSAGRSASERSVGQPTVPHPVEVIAEAHFGAVGVSGDSCDLSASSQAVYTQAAKARFEHETTVLAEPVGRPLDDRGEARVYSDDDFIDEA